MIHRNAENGNSFPVATRDALLTGDLFVRNSQFLTLSNIAIKPLYHVSRKEEKARRRVGIILLMMQQNIARNI